MISDAFLIDRLQILSKRKQDAQKELNQLDGMSWLAFLQLPENKDRLKQFEMSQKNVFENLIKKRHPELKPDFED